MERQIEVPEDLGMCESPQERLSQRSPRLPSLNKFQLKSLVEKQRVLGQGLSILSLGRNIHLINPRKLKMRGTGQINK